MGCFFFQAEDGIRDADVTGVQTCALPISCGRDNVGVENLARVVEERLVEYPQAFEVAVMGCAVNGPGEAGDADFGIAGGRDVGFVYAHGRVLKKVSSDILIDELFFEIDRWIADGMHRPKRLKMAKPAALAMAEASLIPLGDGSE